MTLPSKENKKERSVEKWKTQSELRNTKSPPEGCLPLAELGGVWGSS